jgi:hypothetical protein
MRIADSLVRDHKSAEIHLFSDGAVPELNEFENKALPLIYHRVGKGANNLGIIALDVRANPEDAHQRAVYASVANYSSNNLQTELELSLDGKLLETRPLNIPPGETSPQAFRAAQAADGVFTVRLTAKDDLAADNQASIVSLLPKPIKVLLISRGNKFLEKALRATPNVELAAATDSTDPATGFDLVVLDDVTPTVWPKGNILAIHVLNTNWFDKVTRVESPAIVDWRSAHPVLRYVSLDNIPISESFVVKTPNWAVSLVDSSQASLILAGELGRQRIIWIGFDTLQSLWPYRFSFPMFVQNAADWLNPANSRSEQLMVKPGDAFRLGLARSEKEARVTLPGGLMKTIPIEASANEFVFGETLKQGIYHVRVGTNETFFCSDLLDSAESNIKPREELQVGKYTKVAATTLQRTNMELWRSFAGLGLGVLLFEWWFYHRRTV